MMRSVAGPAEIRAVAVGSASPLKLRVVTDVIGELIPGASVTGIAVDTDVGPQPDSDEQTLAGAEQRAHRALAGTDSDLGVGIESGLQRLGSRLYASTWVVVADQRGLWRAGSSGRVQVPEWLAIELAEGVELEEAIRRATGIVDQGERTGVLGLLTGDRITRSHAIAEALRLALFSLFPPPPTRKS